MTCLPMSAALAAITLSAARFPARGAGRRDASRIRPRTDTVSTADGAPTIDAAALAAFLIAQLASAGPVVFAAYLVLLARRAGFAAQHAVAMSAPIPRPMRCPAGPARRCSSTAALRARPARRSRRRRSRSRAA